MDAAAPESDGLNYPGTIPFAARDGRLRLLQTDGRVFELTWNRELPGGGTIVDAMSPSVTMDGRRILFAGRTGPPGHGRWRCFQMDADGGNLKQLSGGPGDPGCLAVPPLRTGAHGEPLDDATRKHTDYDDLDPADDGAGGFVFSSSRLPDLGRGHSRRATQIWRWSAGENEPFALTANRNNDRWPVVVEARSVLFSMWSRNREVVSRNETELLPDSAGDLAATRPTDLWMGARVFTNATQFGYAVKAAEPVWRPRPLFNGRVVFATAREGGGFRIAQAEWGHLDAAPSSLGANSKLPKLDGGKLLYGPNADSNGVAISAACPSPCPPLHVLFAAAPVASAPAGYGIYFVPEQFYGQVPQLLFDDPAMMDSEPVAIYARGAPSPSERPPLASAPRLDLADGTAYSGPAGFVDNTIINGAVPVPFASQVTTAGKSPAFPPPGRVRAIAVYASHRDRFDDPLKSRSLGRFELVRTVPLEADGTLKAWLPADPLAPTVMAGLDERGRIVRTAGAKDADGNAGEFFSVAGDHYSSTRPNGYHFCIGCHTGHTFITADIAERVR